jgi:hypothetical protein
MMTLLTNKPPTSWTCLGGKSCKIIQIYNCCCSYYISHCLYILQTCAILFVHTNNTVHGGNHAAATAEDDVGGTCCCAGSYTYVIVVVVVVVVQIPFFIELHEFQPWIVWCMSSTCIGISIPTSTSARATAGSVSANKLQTTVESYQGRNCQDVMERRHKPQE